MHKFLGMVRALALGVPNAKKNLAFGIPNTNIFASLGVPNAKKNSTMLQ